MKIHRKSPETLGGIFLPGPGGRTVFGELPEGQLAWQSVLPGGGVADFLQVRPAALPKEAAGPGGG